MLKFWVIHNKKITEKILTRVRMPFFTLILMLIALGIFSMLMLPIIRRQDVWRATVTPLASIIGSGFLIAAPLLNDLSGPFAVWVMLGLCCFSYAVGQVIRWNIEAVEPILSAKNNIPLLTVERFSDIALTCAYVLSVTYYLYLFSSFLHRVLPFEQHHLTQIITTIVLLLIALFGFLKGFKLLEKIELFAVNIKLSIVTVFLLALFIFNLNHVAPEKSVFVFDVHHIPMIMGLLIMVQGFETSRYLGKEYPAAIRVKSMQIAQGLSTFIYILFILLFSLVFALYPLQGRISDTSVIDVAHYIFFGAPIFLLFAAITSQLSAALADFSGNGGLVNELSGRLVPVKVAYLLITVMCLLLVWSFNIFEIINLASKGFAIYYFLQCISSMLVQYKQHWFKFIFSLIVAVLCLMVIIFAQPIEG